MGLRVAGLKKMEKKRRKQRNEEETRNRGEKKENQKPKVMFKPAAAKPNGQILPPGGSG